MRLASLLLLLLAACADERAPVPTAAESERLNDAEVMLDDSAANEQAP